MKTKSKTFLHKISQAGSMMVEAMAMLALISLVTPTLYKKSAERTTELQDINTATHLRTIMKAVDSYVSANYQSLLEDQLKSEDSSMSIDLSSEQDQISKGIHDYFPYGYSFDQVKNFGAPKVVLKRQGMSITSFVELPKMTDIGEMRAARIASMIGSNGGYVNADGDAQGVGGVWSLDSSELNSLGLGNTQGSIVVASSDAINSATSGALENEKYLQRTEVESTDQLWRNTMVTDLYMGGVQDADAMHKILGVDQLILGSTNWEDYDADLVLTDENGYEGSAWLAGTFSALSDSFTVRGTVDAPELAFGAGDGDLLYVNDMEASIWGNADDGNIGLALHKGTNEMETDYATTIRNNLDVSGNTKVASGGTDTSFEAGPDGSYITADANQVRLLNNTVEVLRNAGTGGASTTNVNTTQTNISGDTTIGTAPDTGRGGQVVTNPKLSVQGGGYVRNDLEVGGSLYANEFNTLELHAGGTDFNDKDARWLHATSDGVTVTNPNNITDPILQITKGTDTRMFGPDGDNGGMGSAVILGSKEGQLRGVEKAFLYTTETDGVVNIQDGAIILENKPGATGGNTVDIDADVTTVQDGVFRVTKGASVDGEYTVTSEALYVDPTGAGEVIANADETTVRMEGTDGVFQVVQNSGKEDKGLLKVGPDLDGTSAATATVDNRYFRLSDTSVVVDSNASTNKILEVNLDYNDTTDWENKGSVYIRRGAVELESPSGTGYAADSGYGYVEMGRFVSNAFDMNDDGSIKDGTIATPVYANDGVNAFPGVWYDRYMVNPAYTSVMHDIKLTTRGGARLSDILPDFINKGIYVVNNSYRDTGIDLNSITVGLSGTQLAPTSGSCTSGSGSKCFDDNASGTLSGAAQWGSPFMGVVPAPQCPPGYARVITITPAGFQMAQAGPIVRTPHDVSDEYNNNRFVVDEHSEINKLGLIDENTLSSTTTVTGAQYTPTSIRDQAGNPQPLYYLGHASEPTVTIDGNPYSPQPLYFQQSTWLRSKVQPQAEGVAGSCNPSAGSGEGCGSGFLGWSAIMGFIYPSSFYGDLIGQIKGAQDDDDGNVYWNVFPVRRNTLEAYATVYCYFDRTNLYQSGQNEKYVDPYDQLNNFRKGYSKPDSAYVKRLNDPTLNYTEPW